MSYLLTCLLVMLKQPMMLLAVAVFFSGLAAYFVLHRKRASISVQLTPLFTCLLASLAILYFSLPEIAASVEAQLPPAPPAETGNAAWLGFLFFGILAPYGLVHNLLFPQIQLKLWEHDNLTQRIKVRPYCHFSTICFGIFLLAACALSLHYDSILCAIFLPAAIFYALWRVKIYTTYLHYTQSTLFYHTARTQREIPLSHITDAHWEGRSRTTGAVLVLSISDGTKIELSHCHYMGLRALFSSIPSGSDCAAE